MVQEKNLRKFAEVFGYDYTFDKKDFKGFMQNCPQMIKEIAVFMAKFPTVIKTAAQNNLPNQVVDYINDLSAKFHSLWGANVRFVNTEDENYSKSMMAFAITVQTVLKNALECLGVDAPTIMEKNK